MRRYLKWWTLGALAVVILIAALYLATAAQTDIGGPGSGGGPVEFVPALTP
jgi:hypothetical protein